MFQWPNCQLPSAVQMALPGTEHVSFSKQYLCKTRADPCIFALGLTVQDFL